MNKEELIDELLTRGIERIYPSKEAFEKTLKSGKKLRIYWGTDPTSTQMHIGHAASLFPLRRLQELGHEVIFLIGDFTAKIGDPSDKKATRRQLTDKEIKANLKNFRVQASKIIDFKGKNAAKLMFNSKWLSKMNLADILELTSKVTVQQMIQRDMFQERIKESKAIGVHEFLYPLMQGYDSVVMDVDAEIGGNDQTFNMLVGRDLMRIYKDKEKFVISVKLLTNAEGKKMSKTEGDLINISDEPNDMFGKVMALSDGVMFNLAELATIMPMAEINNLKESLNVLNANPRDTKARIAHWVVKTYHGEKAADKAEDEFNRVFKSKELPEDIAMVKLGKTEIGIVDLLVEVKFAASKSEARRLIEQGGVKIDGMKVAEANLVVPITSKPILLQAGKRHFVKISI